MIKLTQSELDQFIGTEYYHRYNNLLLTDGVLFLAQKGECFWLLDLILSVQDLPQIKDDPYLQCMQFWTLIVNEDQTAKVICERDTDDVVYEQKIDYTDFPFSTRIWLNRYDHRFVAMLSSEY